MGTCIYCGSKCRHECFVCLNCARPLTPDEQSALDFDPLDEESFWVRMETATGED